MPIPHGSGKYVLERTDDGVTKYAIWFWSFMFFCHWTFNWAGMDKLMSPSNAWKRGYRYVRPVTEEEQKHGLVVKVKPELSWP